MVTQLPPGVPGTHLLHFKANPSANSSARINDSSRTFIFLLNYCKQKPHWLCLHTQNFVNPTKFNLIAGYRNTAYMYPKHCNQNKIFIFMRILYNPNQAHSQGCQTRVLNPAQWTFKYSPKAPTLMTPWWSVSCVCVFVYLPVGDGSSCVH